MNALRTHATGGMLFFLILPDREAARIAGRQLVRDGLVVELDDAPDEGRWWLCAHAPLVASCSPESDALATHLEAVARQLSGVFNGWETGWLPMPSDDVLEAESAA